METRPEAVAETASGPSARIARLALMRQSERIGTMRLSKTEKAQVKNLIEKLVAQGRREEREFTARQEGRNVSESDKTKQDRKSLYERIDNLFGIQDAWI